MTNTKKVLKKAVELMAVKSAKTACGTASLNHFAQPKEPKDLKNYFNEK